MADLDAMAVFTQVVESQGFSAAARVLQRSKSAVSKEVGRLEERLGQRLLNRTTRRLSLTEAGAVYLEGCQRMLAEAAAAEQAVSRLAESPRGTLRVNAPMSFGMAHLAPLLPVLLRRCPDLSIDLTLNDRLVDLVEEGYDLGIRIGRLTDSSLVARRLAPARHFLAATPAYLASRGHPEQPRDLGQHDCLIYSYLTEGPTWRFHHRDGRTARVTVRGRLTANNGEALLAAALAGAGVAALPSFLLAEALRDGRLVPLLAGWRLGSDDAGVYAVFPASRHLAPKVRVFVDFLAEQFGDPPSWDIGLDPDLLAR